MSAPGGVAGETEDLGDLVLDRAGPGEHAVGSGPAAAALVEQDGLADAGDYLHCWPVVVIGDQHVLAEDLLFEGGAGTGVYGPRQAQVFGLVTVQVPGDDSPDPGLAGDLLDLGLDLVFAAAGLAAGQGGGQFVEFLADLGQRGAVEAAGLAVM